MIPIVKQNAPNVIVRYYCRKCGKELQDGKQKILLRDPQTWNFCPICGEMIEWDLVVPVDWSDRNCEDCGKWLIQNRKGIPYASSAYIGSSKCEDCQKAYCLQTSCEDCKIGHHPDCKHRRMKLIAIIEKGDGGLGKA